MKAKTTIWIAFIAVILFLFAIETCHGQTRLKYGWDAPIENLQSGYAVFQMVELEIRTHNDPWGLGLVLQGHRAISEIDHEVDGERYNGTEICPAIHGRLSLRKAIGKFFWEIFGGLGIRSDHTQLEWGDSCVLGHFGGAVGYGRFLWGISHYSDPFRDRDKGRNFLFISFQF